MSYEEKNNGFVTGSMVMQYKYKGYLITTRDGGSKNISQKDEWATKYVRKLNKMDWTHQVRTTWEKPPFYQEDVFIHYTANDGWEVGANLEIEYTQIKGEDAMNFLLFHEDKMCEGYFFVEEFDMIKGFLVLAPNEDISEDMIGYVMNKYLGTKDVMGFLYIPKRISDVAMRYLEIKEVVHPYFY